MNKARLDKNGTIIAMGNKVKDEKGKVWKLENFCGVPRLVYPVTGKIDKTIGLSKVDLTKFEKVD